ncbi:MAG: hypothetical protein KF889_21665 [Alphaproteobacteria bacterium]|nr:hypothetical protein [Alphaproteobacteria bacterium]MCW5743641.1 hypothetical protein [Alphaproteobacteria bacterium]
MIAWTVLAGGLALATVLTVSGAGWSKGASAAGFVHAGGDDQHTFILTSEIDHAGA